jgi:unsaturated chondroitin disaccharide hydrolase
MYKRQMKNLLFILTLLIGTAVSCTTSNSFTATKELVYCIQQSQAAILRMPDSTKILRSISRDNKWRFVNYRDWTCGFWPGILWYNYEFTKDAKWKSEAERFSAALFPLVDSAAIDHDLGFQVFCSINNGYRLTGNAVYKSILPYYPGHGKFQVLIGLYVTILSWIT